MKEFLSCISLSDTKNMKRIAREVTGKGFLCYVVGGSVRDALLKTPITDLDFASDATPKQIAEIFPKAIPTGLKYGTMTLLFGKHSYQITTFRREISYHPESRHPAILQFSDNLITDLQRRDFTVNALVYDPIQEKIMDPIGMGLADLQNRLLRCIGEAKERFREDPLRVIRGCRLAAKMNFHIVDQTFQAMKEITRSESLEKLSRERIVQEFKKGLNPRMIDLLLQSGIMEAISLPKLKKNLPSLKLWLAEAENWKQWQKELGKGVRSPLAFLSRFYFLTQGVNRKDLVSDCRSLTFSKQDLRYLSAYFSYFALQESCKPMTTDARFFLSDLKKKLGNSQQLEIFFAGLENVEDNLSLPHPYNYCLEWLQERLAQDPLLITDLKINGHDLLACGVSPRNIGNTLEALLGLVLQNPENNDFKILSQWVHKNVVLQ